MSSQSNYLEQTISIPKGIALAVTIVAGSGIFGLPGLVIDQADITVAAIGWILTTITAIPMIAIFSRLGSRFASSAGLAAYSLAGIGEWAEFSTSIMLVGTFAIGIPGLAMIGAAYAGEIFSQSIAFELCSATIVLLLATFINILGIRIASSINVLTVIGLLCVVFWILFTSFHYSVSSIEITMDAFRDIHNLSIPKLWSVCSLIFWAFLGWESLSFGLEEFKHPQQSIPLVYWGSFFLVTILYLLLASVSIGASKAGIEIHGPAGMLAILYRSPLSFSICGIIITLLIIANAIAWIFSASRLVYAAAGKGVLPKFLNTLSKRNIPINALLTLMLLYLLVIMGLALNLLSVNLLIRLVNQNFIFLYLFSIIAYVRTSHSRWRWFLSLTTFLLCGLLLSGFSWLSIYPLLLLFIGFVLHRWFSRIH